MINRDVDPSNSVWMALVVLPCRVAAATSGGASRMYLRKQGVCMRLALGGIIWLRRQQTQQLRQRAGEASGRLEVKAWAGPNARWRGAGRRGRHQIASLSRSVTCECTSKQKEGLSCVRAESCELRNLRGLRHSSSAVDEYADSSDSCCYQRRLILLR